MLRIQFSLSRRRVFELTDYDVSSFAHVCIHYPLMCDSAQRIVLLDSDMVVRRNMDEIMDIELPSDWIAAAHACACNPRKLPHYPADW